MPKLKKIRIPKTEKRIQAEALGNLTKLFHENLKDKNEIYSVWEKIRKAGLKIGPGHRKKWPEIEGLKELTKAPIELKENEQKPHNDLIRLVRGEKVREFRHVNDSKLDYLKGEIAKQLGIRLTGRYKRDYITFLKINGKNYLAVHAAFKKILYYRSKPKFFEITGKDLIHIIENPEAIQRKK